MEKEFERTEKWMRMMGVKRKVGGNAVEWVWKGEGTSKVCHASDGLFIIALSRFDIQQSIRTREKNPARQGGDFWRDEASRKPDVTGVHWPRCCYTTGYEAKRI